MKSFYFFEDMRTSHDLEPDFSRPGISPRDSVPGWSHTCDNVSSSIKQNSKLTFLCVWSGDGFQVSQSPGAMAGCVLLPGVCSPWPSLQQSAALQHPAPKLQLCAALQGGGAELLSLSVLNWQKCAILSSSAGASSAALPPTLAWCISAPEFGDLTHKNHPQLQPGPAIICIHPKIIGG